jgi:putative ATP-binding cassette transporter
MIIYDLVNRDTKIGIRSLILLGCLSGLANALILVVINIAAEHVTNDGIVSETLYHLALFLLIVTVYYLSQQRLLVHATHHVENSIRAIRLSLIEHLRNCELQTIEKIGHERIFVVMGKELQVISQSAQLFVIIAQSSILVFFTAMYIAWLSVPAFVILTVSISFGAAIHFQRDKEIEDNMAKAFTSESNLITKLTDYLDGFKEIKLNRQRATELQIEYHKNATELNIAKKLILSLFANDFIASQLNFYLSIGAIVFLLPVLSNADPEMITKITTAALFLVGPITGIVGGLPSFTSSNTAAKNVLNLERELSELGSKIHPDPIHTEFHKIELKDLYFQHQVVSGEYAFTIGPVNLCIKQGQTIFITGGNGSGKTTFIKLLTGLYKADSGKILLDNALVTGDKIDAYRNLFSAVFSDFHLFKHLYGIDHPSQKDVDEWLNFLEMSHKVEFKNKEFSSIDLSTGQRKRLALFSAVFEKRPIFIFDELAADQDPYFRNKFYHEILPRLKDRGQTVIAITHDEKYFSVADIQINMDEGHLYQVFPNTQYDR